MKEPFSSTIEKAIGDAVWAFTAVRRRYPLLMKTSAEIDRVRERFTYKFHNDGLMQILRDSFDMLVVDLFSIRESLVERGGVLDQVRENPSYLRRRTPNEFEPNTITVLGASPARRDELMPELQDASRRRIAMDINSAIERLVGCADPVTGAHVDDLIKRLRSETAPLDRDRNRVRAHRYQRGHGDTRFFIELPDLGGQIDVLDRYLRNLHLALTDYGTSTSTSFMYATGTTHEDLADIIVHGSINRATLAYGLALDKPVADAPTPWYWAKRKSALAPREEAGPEGAVQPGAESDGH